MGERGEGEEGKGRRWKESGDNEGRRKWRRWREAGERRGKRGGGRVNETWG